MSILTNSELLAAILFDTAIAQILPAGAADIPDFFLQPLLQLLSFNEEVQCKQAEYDHSQEQYGDEHSAAISKSIGCSEIDGLIRDRYLVTADDRNHVELDIFVWGEFCNILVVPVNILIDLENFGLSYSMPLNRTH